MAGRVPLAGHAALLSGRASYELVQKALRAGVAVLAAIGAPSSLAVNLAVASGLTLVGFLRDGHATSTQIPSDSPGSATRAPSTTSQPEPPAAPAPNAPALSQA